MNASAPFRYPGAKNQLAEWIISTFPPHRTYVEPFLGSGAVFFRKAPSASEYLGDQDGFVVRFFRVLREQPDALAYALRCTPYAREEYRAADLTAELGDVEFARRFVIAQQMSIGGSAGQRSRAGWRHDGVTRGRSGTITQWRGLPERVQTCAARLLGTHIECLDAAELITRLSGPDVLIYADPPYPDDVRGRTGSRGRLYREEMQDQESHLRLLAVLRAHPGPVVLSGYRCALYDDHLPGWKRLDRAAVADGGNERTESLWVNASVQAHLDVSAAPVTPGLFD